MRLPTGVFCFILLSLLTRNRSWPSLERVTSLNSGVAAVRDEKAGVAQFVLAAHAVEVGLPTLAVGRIGEHEVELARRKGVLGERGAELEVFRLFSFALQQQVGLADGVGFRLTLLAEQVDGDILAVLPGEATQGVLGDGQHAAGAAGTVVDEIRPRFDLFGNRQKDQVGHECAQRRAA